MGLIEGKMNCHNCKNDYDNNIEFLCPSCGRYEIVSLFSEIPIYVKFLKDLVNKTSTIIDRLQRQGVDRDDFRRAKLGAFNIPTLATVLDLEDYDQDIRYNDSRIPKIITQSNPKLSEKSLQDLVENIDIRNRISYLTISLFQFENLFVQLAKHQGFNKRETYWNVSHYIINNSTLDNKTEKIHALILPSIVRNTLHSRGIYRNEKNSTLVLTVKNISFKFENNKPHDFSSWREIIFYFNNIIDVIDELFKTKKYSW